MAAGAKMPKKPWKKRQRTCLDEKVLNYVCSKGLIA